MTSTISWRRRRITSTTTRGEKKQLVVLLGVTQTDIYMYIRALVWCKTINSANETRARSKGRRKTEETAAGILCVIYAPTKDREDRRDWFERQVE